MKKNDQQHYIQWFRDAAPYINAHRQQIFVLTFGGEALLDESFSTLIHDISLLNSLGIKLVLVHGARPQINAKLKQQKIKPEYVNDLRITDDASLASVKEAIGSVRLEVEALLSMGLINTPMSGSQINVTSGNFITAKPYGIHDGIDYCHTGVIRKINYAAIKQQLDTGNIVLLSSLGYSPTGEVFNLRAEDVATHVATTLNADKLIFMVEGKGLLDNKNKPIRQLTVPEAKTLLEKKTKLDTLIKKDLRSAISACNQNVNRVHLIKREDDGALLQELFTRDGAGCLVTAEKFESLRSATIDDVGGILELIAPLEDKGAMVKRSREQLELEIDKFTVIERDGMIIGCAALYPYLQEKMGELACVSIHAQYQNTGRGLILLNAIEKRAEQLGLNILFALTTQTSHWFRQHGFASSDIKNLPIKKRELYNYQRNSKILTKNL